MFRKDHCEGASGVFICIKEALSASEIQSLDTDAEIVWVKIDVFKEIQFLFVHFIDLLTIYYSHLYSYVYNNPVINC